MDLAYDHIQEEAFKKDDENPAPSSSKPEQQHTLNDDLQDAYRAFSSSAWGSRIGGFFGTVVKQGESVYREAQQELSAVGTEATRGFSDLRESLINRTRSLSLTTSPPRPTETARDGADGGADKDGEGSTPTNSRSQAGTAAGSEDESVLSRLRIEAAKRLKDIQRAEEAADEALLKFGSNISDFLRDAVRIAPPTSGGPGEQGSSEVLFESKDAHGKRVIHTSRFDAQLHVIHTTTDGFAKDPAVEEFGTWAKDFDVEEKTADISDNLAKYPELRTTMEKLVPDQVPYVDFWKRYYFLRHGIETAEARRRDLLKAAEAEDEVGWGDDSDDEAAPSKSAAAAAAAATPNPNNRPPSTESSTTIQPPPAITVRAAPVESRKSNDEKSQADSDASYDVVGAASGNPSQAPNSPKESRKGDDSDEDWE